MPHPRSILVIGASGETGIRILRASANHSDKPEVHAFVRNPDKLPDTDRDLCSSIQTGDARKVDEVKSALTATKCDTVIMAVGSGTTSKGENDIRKTTALILTKVIQECQMDIYVIVVSSVGAGDSKIQMGFGFGMLLSYILKHVLADHTRQEQIFQDSFTDKSDHLLIVRPTGLTNDKASGNVAVSEDDNLVSKRIDRQDLAEWLLNVACDRSYFGKVVAVTGGK